MNLLTDPWIPVTHNVKFQHIRLMDVLCREEYWRITLTRDDMELAALQLAICLTQVILPPKDANELRERERAPLSESVYQNAIEPYQDWFVVDHPKHPFMQTRGVKAKEATPIQKLFPGMPEGNNHSLFNDAGEIGKICGSCAAIALFHQAINCPSFGGGFKPGLRGSAPITTLASGLTLRSTIWRNILHSKTWFHDEYSSAGNANKPVWIDNIKKGETIQQSKIGVMRGLFWQPAHVWLNWLETPSICDSCGTRADRLVISFDKEKFTFDVKGQWPHPHSPKKLQIKKGSKQEIFLSFTTSAPAWTQLSGMIMKRDGGKEGGEQAAVMGQYASVFKRQKLDLIIGGYRNNQASILERRHEIISLPAGWDESMEKIEETLNLALRIKNALRSKLYGFAKLIGMTGISALAEDRFYQDSEAIIHQTLRRMNPQQLSNARAQMTNELIKLARSIFNETTQPYQHDPKMIKALAVAKRSLNKVLGGFKEEKSK